MQMTQVFMLMMARTECHIQMAFGPLHKVV